MQGTALPLTSGDASPRLPLPVDAPSGSCSAPPLPTGPCPVCPRLDQDFEPWRQAGYWKAQHQRAVQREAQLQQRIAELEAKLLLREQQLFGTKTETTASTFPAPAPTNTAAPLDPAANNAADRDPTVATILTCRSSWRTVRFQGISATALTAAVLSPRSAAPRTPLSWRSR